MNESKISVRYAKALFSLSQENNILPAVKNDVNELQEVCRENSEFVAMLESPVVKTSQKQLVCEQIFRNQISETTLTFLSLLISHKREIFLENICRNFTDLYRNHLGIKAVSITSVVPLQEQERTKLISNIKLQFGCEVELTEKMDNSLIGGFVLQIDDKLFDASLSAKLQKIKQNLS